MVWNQTNIYDVGKIEHCLCCFLLWKPMKTLSVPWGFSTCRADATGTYCSRASSICRSVVSAVNLLLGLRSWLKWHGYSMSLGFSENHILAYPIFSRKCDIFWESHSIFYWEKGLCTSTTHFMAISQRNTQRVPGRSRWRAAWRRKEPEQMKLGPLAKGQL